MIWFNNNILWPSTGWGCAQLLFFTSFLCHRKYLSLLKHSLHYKCLGHCFLLGSVAHTHACTNPFLSNVSCNYFVCQATALFLHTFVLRLIRIPWKLSWMTIRDLGNCVHHVISATSSLPVTYTPCASLRPLLWQTPWFYQRKCFLLTAILSSNLYPLSFSLLCS